VVVVVVVEEEECLSDGRGGRARGPDCRSTVSVGGCVACICVGFGGAEMWGARQKTTPAFTSQILKRVLTNAGQKGSCGSIHLDSF
jgi:hypothetical protein